MMLIDLNLALHRVHMTNYHYDLNTMIDYHTLYLDLLVIYHVAYIHSIVDLD